MGLKEIKKNQQRKKGNWCKRKEKKNMNDNATTS
jgi:hypothetical protein